MFFVAILSALPPPRFAAASPRFAAASPRFAAASPRTTTVQAKFVGAALAAAFAAKNEASSGAEPSRELSLEEKEDPRNCCIIERMLSSDSVSGEQDKKPRHRSSTESRAERRSLSGVRFKAST